MNIELNPSHSSSTWIKDILKSTQQSSNGRVEHHLVGATLQSRYKNLPIKLLTSKTSKVSNFAVNQIIYYIGAYPSQGLIQACVENISMGIHPILLLPVEQKNKAQILAQDEGIEKELTIISLEDFFAINVIELATEGKKDPFTVLKEIVQIYNKRLEEVETDLSLRIEVK
jgi:hypothetical protein